MDPHLTVHDGHRYSREVRAFEETVMCLRPTGWSEGRRRIDSFGKHLDRVSRSLPRNQRDFSASSRRASGEARRCRARKRNSVRERTKSTHRKGRFSIGSAPGRDRTHQPEKGRRHGPTTRERTSKRSGSSSNLASRRGLGTNDRKQDGPGYGSEPTGLKSIGLLPV